MRPSLDVQAIEQSLLEIISDNRPAAVIFAARCAFRAIPFLAFHGHFDYWRSGSDHAGPASKAASMEVSDKGLAGNITEDPRAKYIGSLWFVLSRTYQLDQQHLELPLHYENAVSALEVAEGQAEAFEVSYACRAVIDAFSSLVAEKEQDIAQSAAYCAQSIFSMCESIHEDIDALIRLIDDELELLKNKQNWQDIFGLPLWNKFQLGELKELINKAWLPQLRSLAKDINASGEDSSYIEQIPRLYEQLLEGSYPVPDIKGPDAPSLDQYIPERRSHSEKPASDDALNRSDLVSALSELMLAPENNGHYTYGLLGDWGSGKSSVIEILKDKLSKESENQDIDFLYGEFNAWKYEHCDDIQAALTHEAISALSNFDAWPRFNRFRLALRLAHYLKPYRFRLFASCLIILMIITAYTLYQPAWLVGLYTKVIKGSVPLQVFGVAVPFAMLAAIYKQAKGLFKLPLAKSMATYLRLPSYDKHLGTLPKMHEHIQALCSLRLNKTWNAKREQRLLFVIDDLDRCGPEGIVKTLEAIRLVMNINRVTVIIAVDQRIALAALALHYKQMAEFHEQKNALFVARDYLAKVIHVPLCLRKSDPETIEGYLSKLWQEDEAIDKSEPEYKIGLDPKIKELSREAPLRQQSYTVQENTYLGDHPVTGVPKYGSLRVPSSDETLVSNSLEDRKSILEVEKEEDKEAQVAKKIEGLSNTQKMAIKAVFKRLEIANPRQIKRLLASYNLIRHYYQDEERVFEGLSESALEDISSFPRLLCLCVMEVLNQGQNLELRCEIYKGLDCLNRGQNTSVFDDVNHPELALEEVIKVVKAKPGLITEVEPFVLPAVYMEDGSAA